MIKFCKWKWIYRVSKHSSVSFLGISILQSFDLRMKSTQFWCCIRHNKMHFKMKRSVCGAFCLVVHQRFQLLHLFSTPSVRCIQKEPFKKWLRHSTSATNNSPCMSCNVGFNFISFNRILLFFVIGFYFSTPWILHAYCMNCIAYINKCQVQASLSRIQIYSQWQSVNELAINNSKLIVS